MDTAVHQTRRVESSGRLELLQCGPDAEGEPPLLFLHGAFTGAWCWAEHFMPYFARAGFCCYALSMRGHGASEGRERMSLHGIRHYVDDLAEAIEHIVEHVGAAPVLVGHSMGGLVVQKYLEQAELPAVVLVASVPPHGLVPASMSLALLKPQLLSELNALLYQRRASVDALRQALFSGPIAADRLQRYYTLMQPESPRAIWDMALFDLPQTWRMQVPRMLILGAELDVMVPPQQVEACARAYGTEAEIFPGIGHAMMLDCGWQRVADRILDWLRAA